MSKVKRLCKSQLLQKIGFLSWVAYKETFLTFDIELTDENQNKKNGRNVPGNAFQDALNKLWKADWVGGWGVEWGDQLWERSFPRNLDLKSSHATYPVNIAPSLTYSPTSKLFSLKKVHTHAHYCAATIKVWAEREEPNSVLFLSEAKYYFLKDIYSEDSKLKYVILVLKPLETFQATIWTTENLIFVGMTTL